MIWTVELPDTEVVNHNTRGHWNRRYGSHRQWKENTTWIAKTATQPFPDPPVVVTLKCVQSDRRRRDTDNWVAGTALKGAIDGLVEAGLLLDDSWRYVREVRCRLLSNPALDCHRWTLTVTPAPLDDGEVTF